MEARPTGIHRAACAQAVAVNGVDAHQQGNAQAGLRRQHLQLMRLFAGKDVQESSHLAIADALGQFGIAQVLVGGIDVFVR